MPVLLTLALSLGSLVEAGQMPNPLRVFGQDGREYQIFFRADGVEFEGTVFEPTGRNKWRSSSDSGGCDGALPELVDTEVSIVGTSVEVRRTSRFRPCGKRPTADSTQIRRLSYFPPADPAPCTAGQRRFAQGGLELTVDFKCDATMAISRDGMEPLILSEGKPRRFAGRDRKRIASLELAADGRTATLNVRTPFELLKGRWELAPDP